MGCSRGSFGTVADAALAAVGLEAEAAMEARVFFARSGMRTAIGSIFPRALAESGVSGIESRLGFLAGVFGSVAWAAADVLGSALGVDFSTGALIGAVLVVVVVGVAPERAWDRKLIRGEGRNALALDWASEPTTATLGTLG